ncbi:MAG TPA: copper chaperone PCu(A)C, partial [Sphingomicrobium sp.]|nr:copper chaperone PCu(A)C [Sphingomicrobium sp.]
MPFGRTAIALAALLLVSCAPKRTDPPQISISGAWSRATAAGQSTAAVYLGIANKGGGDDKLLNASTPIGQATLHSSTMDGGVMRMRPLESLDIPAQSMVQLKPGGTHIMVTGVKQPLIAGSSFPLALHF